MQARAIFVLSMLLGSADLIYINFWLAPKAWPPSKLTRTQLSSPLKHRLVVENQQLASNPSVPVQSGNKQERRLPTKPLVPEKNQPTADDVQNNSLTPIITPVVRFDTDQWQNLSPEANHQLKRILTQLQHNPNLRIIIEGHSDVRGELPYNYRLSKLRAQTVFQFLSKQGISKQRIRIQALGPSKPEDPNNTPAAWATNRRVVIRLER